jgi:hypothetical protein
VCVPGLTARGGGIDDAALTDGARCTFTYYSTLGTACQDLPGIPNVSPLKEGMFTN